MACEKWLYDKLYSETSSFDEMTEKWNSIVESEQNKALAARRIFSPKTAGLITTYHAEKKKKANVTATLSHM